MAPSRTSTAAYVKINDTAIDYDHLKKRLFSKNSNYNNYATEVSNPTLPAIYRSNPTSAMPRLYPYHQRGPTFNNLSQPFTLSILYLRHFSPSTQRPHPKDKPLHINRDTYRITTCC